MEQPIGYAWIKGKQKPIYSARKISRGKNKGEYEVTYLNKIGYNNPEFDRTFKKARVETIRLMEDKEMKDKTMKELVEIYNGLAAAQGKDLVKINTFNSKDKIIDRIKELQVVEEPEKIEKVRKPRTSKLQIFREQITQKGEITREEALNLTGFDQKNLHVAISILKNPKRTKDPLDVKYDKNSQTFYL